MPGELAIGSVAMSALGNSEASSHGQRGDYDPTRHIASQHEGAVRTQVPEAAEANCQPATVEAIGDDTSEMLAVAVVNVFQ